MREETRAYLKKSALKISAYVISIVILIIILSVVAVTLNKKLSKVSYEGEMIIHTKPLKSDSSTNILIQLGRPGTKIDTSPRIKHQNIWSVVLQREKQLDYVEKILKESDIGYSVVIEDMQSLIDSQEEEIRKRKLLHTKSTFDLENFHPYEEVSSFLVKLGQKNDLVQVSSLGKTHEDRDILLATVSTDSKSNKPIVFIDCTLHAREWIATAVCLWILNEISSKYKKDPEIFSLLESYDWLIQPIANPDGYAYTWDKDRLWKKNRAPIIGTSCYGIDLNRNFGSEPSDPFSARNTESSSDPCSDSYAGSKPFSEAETRATRDILERYKNRIKLVIFLHSGTQSWLSAYAINSTKPVHYEEMDRLMKEATTAIQAIYGTQYYYGTVNEVLAGSSYTALDYSYDQLNIVHSYLIELPDGYNYSYMLLPARIVPTATETLNGIKAALNVLRN